MKQTIANFLRKLIKLDDYIEDRVFTDIERLEREIEVVNELTDSNGLDLNDRPTFYDMEDQVGELITDEMADIVERLDKLENFFGRKEDK